MNATHSEPTGLEIAVVGMSCHFPGATSLLAFLDNLRQGVESIRFFDEEELRQAGTSAELLAHPGYVRAAAALDGIDRFDAGYFGYTPREAELIDPQQRLLLECAAEALEHAGFDPERFPGRIGVYAGMTQSGYAAQLARSTQLRGLVDGFEILVGNDRDFLASRVAYKLNLDGPALVVQTACSSSLSAIHVACQALLAGDCDMALAGGVSVRIPHHRGYLYQPDGITSPDGHCRPFDARAQGTVPGSGVGVVVLRRLADALSSGDAVEAVIRGSAVNNDGGHRVGFTAPRVEGQAQVVRAALATAEVEPASIGYIEAHGTATALGDPIEIAALNQAFAGARGHRCAIGSVKGNFGHLDAAAGVAGFVKAVLALKHGQLFPSLHFERPNPKADFAGGPFHVNTRLEEWPRNGGPRRAGVSSFGMGGTNVHVVLEEAPEPEPADSRTVTRLLALSGRTETALATSRSALVAHLRAHPHLDLAHVSHTLGVGRRRLEHRMAVVADDLEQATQQLEAGGSARVHAGRKRGPDPAVAFMFTGQGAQRAGMGKGLYEAEPVYRRHLDDCCERLRGALGLDLRDLLHAPEDRRAAADEELLRTELAQPALFAVEYALAGLWRSLGLEPQAMIGHSVGEYVAACLAGVFELDDALSLIAERGRLMGSCAPGAMLAVAEAADRLVPILDETVSLAAVNAPELCVIAGPAEAIEAWQHKLGERGVAATRLRTRHAFHSAAMETVLEAFRQRVADTPRRAPERPFLSNLTGTWITAAQASDPAYWASQLRSPVLFAQGVSELLRDPGLVLLEVGPGQTLAGLARRQLDAESTGRVVASLAVPAKGGDERRAWLEAVAQLWVGGVEMDLGATLSAAERRRVRLPTQPFERRSYWIEPERPETLPVQVRKRTDPADWFYSPSWRRITEARAAQPVRDGSPLCLYLDRRGVGAALAERLRQQGQSVLLVEAGTGYGRLGPDRFSVDPQEPSDHRRLFETLSGEGRAPRQIVHLLGIDDAARRDGMGCFDVVALAQAIGAAELSGVRLTVVTGGAQDVTGHEPFFPVKTAVAGITRVIAMEYPGVVCRSVDLDLSRLEGGVDPAAEMIPQLEAELLSDAAEPLVALRGRYRWAPALDPIRLPSVEGAPSRLRQRGVYLITGGLGGVGLALARHLATAHQARLVLVSRTGLASPDTTRAAAVEQLEAAGAEVLVVQADVARREQMDRAVSEAERRFGRIDGVIHAAGVAGAGLIQRKSREQLRSVLAPKVEGTLVLHEIFAGRELDFMVLCSSLTAELSTTGQADYAAANVFLDAFAQAQARGGGAPVVSIAWDTWREAGMAVDVSLPAELRERRAELLSHGLTHPEGVDVFLRALEAGLPRVAVSTRPLHERGLGARVEREAAPSVAAPAAARPRRHPRPSLQNDYVAPRSELERWLAEDWQELLGLEPVGVTDNFFELGAESLSALRMVGRLKERRGLEVSLVRLYERPTIALLAEDLEGDARAVATQSRPLEASGRRGEARAEALQRRKRGRRPTGESEIGRRP